MHPFPALLPLCKTTDKLTRRILLKRDDWDIWQQAEYKQLNSYKAQNTFGAPIPRPAPNSNEKGTLVHPSVLPFFGTYRLKDIIEPKARGTCNGGQCYGRTVTLAHTYASCVKKLAARLFWTLSAIEGMAIIGSSFYGHQLTMVDRISRQPSDSAWICSPNPTRYPRTSMREFC